MSLFFLRELLDQVAEFEKSEYTSSNKKVGFYFNQIIIKYHVESWQMFKILVLTLLCLRENQNPILFLQNSLLNCPKSHILHFGTKAASELPWLFPDCLFCTSGVCLTHLKVSQTRDVLQHLLLSYLPLAPGDIRLSQHKLKSWEDRTVQILH